MNSLSRGILLSRVTSFLSNTKSSTCNINPSIFFLESNNQPSAKTFHTQCVYRVAAAQHVDSETGFVRRIIEKYNLFNIYDIRLKQTGYLLYEDVADNIDYQAFFTEFKMNDSFFSWFLITELHIWMLMARTMAEQKEGKVIRNGIVEAMWGDAFARAKILCKDNPGSVKSKMQELSEQFNSAIIGYDEGICGDDKVLAGAIWRRFFQLECNNPEDIEKLLLYVRKQVYLLDKVSKQDILSKPVIAWLSLKDLQVSQQLE